MTTQLLSHYEPRPGYTQIVTPQTHPIAWLDFGMLSLAAEQSYELASGGAEVGLVILTGACSIQVDGQRFTDLGGRASVFEGRATAVYVPCQAQARIEAGAQGVEIAVCRSATQTRYPAQVVRPEEVLAREVGGPGFTRYVHDILGPQVQASGMIVGETYTVQGNWSSFPPHKHDVEDLPNEVRQEELYLYKVRPEEGFGVQYLYSRPDSPHGPLDLPLIVRQNDITLMPFGYHPVAAPPGYDVYYLWFLSGPTRLMRPNDDPQHAWIKTAHEREAARFYPH